MTASLPDEIKRVFETFITTEYTTVDRRGQPISWPVTPYYERGGPCIDVTTGIGYPKKAKDARLNPKVSLLFSDPTGSGMESAPQVLIQGTAEVDDRDLDANRERYVRESAAKLPETMKMAPPKAIQGLFAWYYKRIYVHVRPERVYVWAGRRPHHRAAALRRPHGGGPLRPRRGAGRRARSRPRAAGMVWDERLDELGSRYPHAVVSLVAPDGFPFSVRVPISVDRAAGRIHLGAGVLGLPVQPGLACLTAHDHHPDFTWQRNFQVRGDLVEDGDGWALIPHKLIGGFELPPSSTIAKYRINAGKMIRYRKKAKQELRERGG